MAKIANKVLIKWYLGIKRERSKEQILVDNLFFICKGIIRFKIWKDQHYSEHSQVNDELYADSYAETKNCC